MPRRSGSKAVAAATARHPKRRAASAAEARGQHHHRCLHERRRLAYESARILVEQGPGEFDRARRKAAARLGITDKRCWPDNEEINDALIAQQRLFEPDLDADVADLRRHALQAMRELAAFRPRLVGPALRGTATRAHGVELRLFADSPEEVLMALMDRRIPWRERELTARFGNGAVQMHPVFEFVAGDVPVHLQVLPWHALRQPPLDPVSDRPERGIDAEELAALLADMGGPSAADDADA
jgi:hypothetical protein